MTLNGPSAGERKGSRTDQRHKRWYPCNRQRSTGCLETFAGVRIDEDLQFAVDGTSEQVAGVVNVQV